ncbi:hypothetical protein M0811_00143 [Anaeramoeba ignava]|uniref:Uncharacterized protein n=1 Tax=Anaeramoeba ignava TaxID=1746090 RepID=A0A9Q0LQH4_ANAIG|nr:hypothetical protein M0811_00143 [Anaeramoeba ignava]
MKQNHSKFSQIKEINLPQINSFEKNNQQYKFPQKTQKQNLRLNSRAKSSPNYSENTISLKKPNPKSNIKKNSFQNNNFHNNFNQELEEITNQNSSINPKKEIEIEKEISNILKFDNNLSPFILNEEKQNKFIQEIELLQSKINRVLKDFSETKIYSNLNLNSTLISSQNFENEEFKPFLNDNYNFIQLLENWGLLEIHDIFINSLQNPNQIEKYSRK